jgi:DNA repair and recombination protein RAD52
MYEYSREEIAILQSRLEKQLGPEFLSDRPGNGQGKVHYISGDKCIALANDIFGFNGWSSSIVSIETDYFEEDRQSKRANVGIAVVVRVTLRDGTYHEDVGYGIVANGQSKGTAFQKAKKEGTTDALKRALRQFGNVLGNCLYDKTYLSKVTKIKAAPPKFDESRLHRHPDYVVKKEAQTAEEPKKEQPAVALAQPPPPQCEPGYAYGRHVR